MDLGLSDEQTALRDSARSFLAAECPISLVREQIADRGAFPDRLWQRMAELGWLGLLIPERYGGSGLGMVDVAILLEELGRVLCPAPFVSTAVVAATILVHGGTEAQRAQWLPPLAAGRLRVALALLEETNSWSPEFVRYEARAEGDRFVLTGRKPFVLDAPAADRLLVVARTVGRDAHPSTGTVDDGLALFLVEADAPGVSIRALDYNDRTRPLGEITFDRVTLTSDQRVGDAAPVGAALARALDAARTAICAEQAGAAQRVLELSVEYARNREQFGQPIGRFQALQHRCADMLIHTEGIRSAAFYAAWALDDDAVDASTSARLAKAYSADAGLAVAGQGIQIHGGLGFTWEQDLQLYYKRAQAAALEYGSPSELREWAADHLIGPVPSAAGPAPVSR